MKKKMGMKTVVLFIINSVIGTGIFLSPGGVVKQVGTWTPLIYFVAATIATLLGISYSSASRYVSENGAAYVYSKKAFGKNVGIYIGVTIFVASCIFWGVLLTAFTKYTLFLFGFNQSSQQLIIFGMILLIVILYGINLCGLKIIKIINNCATIGKISVLALSVIVGVIVVIMSNHNQFSAVDTYIVAQNQSIITPFQFNSLIAVIITAFFAYGGFDAITYTLSDVDQPETTIPKAMPIALLIITLIYIGVISVGMMVDSQLLVQTNEVVALAGVFKQPIIKTLISIGAWISMLGINVAFSFSLPRIAQVMAIDQLLPTIIAKENRFKKSSYAYFLTAVMSIIIPLCFNFELDSIMIMSMIALFLQYIIVPSSVIVFYFGKNRESIIMPVKNKWLDVVIPSLAIMMIITLIVLFDWQKQFTVMINGVAQLNYPAIIALVIGFVFFPLMVYIYHYQKNK